MHEGYGSIHDEQPHGEDVGRPDWDARERMEAEEENEWNPNPSLPTALKSVDQAEAGSSNAQEGSESPSVERGDTFPGESIGQDYDAGRYDLEEEEEGGYAQAETPAGAAEASAPVGPDHDDAAQDEDDQDGDQQQLTDGPGAVHAQEAARADVMTTETSMARQPMPLGERGHDVIDRWVGMAGRHGGREAFKTGLVLPLLASLGHDVFDPSTVSPIEDEGGAHDGYLVSSEGGDAFVVVLDEGDLPDDHKDDVVVRLRRDRALLSVRIAGDGEEMRWQGVADVTYASRAAREALGLLGREAFSRDAVADMATLVHRQHEDVQQAVRDVIGNPGDGFLSDVRLRLVAMGHVDPVLLEERVSAITARLLAGPVSEDDSEESEDEPKRREMTPAETRAVEIIREICAEHVAGSLIVPRPGKNYTAILFQDNNRKTLARLHFAAASVKYIGIFVDGEETRHAIGGAEDVRKHAEGILARLRELDPSAFVD